MSTDVVAVDQIRGLAAAARSALERRTDHCALTRQLPGRRPPGAGTWSPAEQLTGTGSTSGVGAHASRVRLTSGTAWPRQRARHAQVSGSASGAEARRPRGMRRERRAERRAGRPRPEKTAGSRTPSGRKPADRVWFALAVAHVNRTGRGIAAACPRSCSEPTSGPAGSVDGGGAERAARLSSSRRPRAPSGRRRGDPVPSRRSGSGGSRSRAGR